MRNHENVEQPVNFTNLPERFTLEGEDYLEQRAADRKPFFLFMSYDQVHTALHTSNKFKGKLRLMRHDIFIHINWFTKANGTQLFLIGTPCCSNSKMHAPLEVAKGYHAGYRKAKINLN